MPIVVEIENTEELRRWGLGLEKVQERCHFCRCETRHWHNSTNTPVCEPCAATHDDNELPVRRTQTSSQGAVDMADARVQSALAARVQRHGQSYSPDYREHIYTVCEDLFALRLNPTLPALNAQPGEFGADAYYRAYRQALDQALERQNVAAAEA